MNGLGVTEEVVKECIKAKWFRWWEVIGVVCHKRLWL